MSEEEQIDAELRTLGYDPKQVALRGRVLVSALVANQELRAELDRREGELMGVLAHHERNWRAIADALPIPCFAGVDIDHNSAEVIRVYRALSRKSPADEVERAREALQAKSDRAYLDYHGELNRTECLGEEAKIKTGRFGVFELNAHRKASEYLGRHRAYADAVALLAALSSAPTAGRGE